MRLRGRLRPGGDGASGLVIAGPGDPEARVTVEVVTADGAWSVRETDGAAVLREEPVAVSGCRNTTVFGFSDRCSWDESGEAAPLMFTEDYVAKPAFPAVQEALR